MKDLVVFILQVVILFFLSRQATRTIFLFLHLFTKNERLIFYLMALLYLPGTIVHEMSHFAAAILLFLKVQGVSIFPVIEDRHIKLGSVIYEKKDFVRSFLVGIAPFFGSLLVFYLMAQLQWSDLFFLYLYLIFTLSSTMFSSRRDLADFLYMIPLVLIVFGVVYILRFDRLVFFHKGPFALGMIEFFKTVNFYLLVAVLINILIIFMLKIIKSLFRP